MEEIKRRDYILIDGEEHLFSLIIDSGLGIEVCPIKVANEMSGSEIPQVARTYLAK